MGFLRHVVRWQAVLWGLAGVTCIVAPGFVAANLVRSTGTETVWVRLIGVTAVVLAAQMVLVVRRLEELWWWTWSFAFLESGVALASVAQAVLTSDDSGWPWLGVTAVSVALLSLDVVGLAKAGTERTPV